MPKDIYYVYTYYDPRNGDPIYVGLGKNNRALRKTIAFVEFMFGKELNHASIF